MICINCFHDKTTTKNSRKYTKHPSVWRRRSCPECGAVFTTYERATLDEHTVRAQDGSTSPFNLGRLIISISRSFQHNERAAACDSYFLAQTVQERIIGQGKSLSAQVIAQVTHMVLQRYDPVAAIQYAAQHRLITSQRRGRPSTVYVQSPSGEH